MSVRSEEQQVGPLWHARALETLHHGALVLAAVPRSPECVVEGVSGDPLVVDGPGGDERLGHHATWRCVIGNANKHVE